VAFAFSGHAAAVANAELGYAVSVDMLHLLGMAAWVGGLLYISSVLMPTLHRLNLHQYAHMLAQGMPEFSALAITSAIVLAATGSLNTSIHLASLQQFLTTLYGWILAVKIEFFLLMATISAYHAFSLRPRLVQALTRRKEIGVDATKQALVTMSPSGIAHTERHAAPEKTEDQGDEERISEQAQRLAEHMEDWLRREAMLGAIVLLCVALLGVFAGTLTP
jgi:putative copper export protein